MLSFVIFVINLNIVRIYDIYFASSKIQDQINESDFLAPFCVTLSNSIIQAVLIDYFATSKLVDNFTIYNTILAFVLYFVIQDIYFYFVHRLMHLQVFYDYIHKMHHKYKTPTIYMTYYAHPIDHLIEWSIVYVVLPYFIEINKYFYWGFVFYTTLTSIIGHSGNDYKVNSYFSDFDWLFKKTNKYINYQPLHHDIHHLEKRCNYSLYFTIFDRYFETLSKNYDYFIDKQ